MKFAAAPHASHFESDVSIVGTVSGFGLGGLSKELGIEDLIEGLPAKCAECGG